MNDKFIIMFLSENDGKRLSFKISSLVLKLSTVLFLCSICFCLIFISGYIHLIMRNKSYKNAISILETDMKKLQEDHNDSSVYRQWADSIIFKRLNFEDNIMGTGTGNKSNNSSESDVQDVKQFQTDSPLSIDDFDVTRVNLALDFNCSFKLVNKKPGTSKLTGYLFMVASSTDITPSAYITWPQADLENGIPKNYRQGSTFDIRHMKYIKGRINQDDIGTKFNHLEVIAYSQDGTIILKKGFSIENRLQQSPFE